MINVFKKLIFACIMLATVFFVVSEVKKDEDISLVKEAEAENVAANTYIYLEKPSSWTKSVVMVMFGKSGYSRGYTMTNISGTNIYYIKMAAWNGYTQYAFLNDNSLWGESKTESVTDRLKWSSLNSGDLYSSYKVNSNYNFFNSSFAGTYSSTYDGLNISLAAKTGTGGTVSISGEQLSSATGVTSVNSENVKVLRTTSATFNATPSAGYKFSGWYTAETGGALESSLATYTVPNVTEGKTLYARWEGLPYKVTLDHDGGSDGTASVDATYGSAMPSITTPKLDGYTFGGYYTEKKGGGTQYYKTDGKSAKNWDKTSATTLYAKWTVNKYQITFVENDGSEVADITADYNTAITLPTSEKTGYTFAGWYTDNTTFNNKFESTTMPLNGATLYAKWKINQYSMTFEENGGNIVSDFVDYDYNTAITLPEPTPGPTLTGYIFDGWYEDAELTIPATFTNIPAKDVTLYAKWIEPIYTTFDYNGLTIGGQTSVTVTNPYNTGPHDVLEVPYVPGYEFLGWYTGKQGTTSPITQYTASKDTTYYAKWVKAPTFVNADLILDYYYEINEFGEYIPHVTSVGINFYAIVSDSKNKTYANENYSYTLYVIVDEETIGTSTTFTSETIKEKLYIRPAVITELKVSDFTKNFTIELVIKNGDETIHIDDGITYNISTLVEDYVSNRMEDLTSTEYKVVYYLHDELCHNKKGTVMSYDDDYHYEECEICGKNIQNEHQFDAGVTTNSGTLYTCSICGGTKTVRNYELTINYHGVESSSAYDVRSSVSNIYNESLTAFDRYNILSPTVDNKLANRPYLSGILYSNLSYDVYYHSYDVWDGNYADGIKLGKGTAESPYIIMTAEELAFMINKKKRDEYYKLGCSIDLNNIPWHGIGSLDAPFKGNFDGQGYSIYNVNIVGDGANKGFFNCATDNESGTAEIKKLTIVGSVNSTSGKVGILVGNSSIKITDCYVYGTVNSTGDEVGLIAGVQNNNATGCYGYGIVTGGNHVGGLFGSVTATTAITISKCYNDTIVTATALTEDPASSKLNNAGLGGVVGIASNNVTITGCINTGEVSTNDLDKGTGGIAGNIVNSSILESINYADINAINGVGGVVGIVQLSSTVNTCYNHGDINGNSNIGGIAGIVRHNSSETYNALYSTISGCTNTGDIVATAGHVGGIVGDLKEYSKVVNSINNGNVHAKGTTQNGVGGIVGSARKGTMISGSTNNGNLTSEQLLGGIIGYVNGSADEPVSLSNNTNNGVINCTANKSTNGYTGGIIGMYSSSNKPEVSGNVNNGTIVNKYSADNVNNFCGNDKNLNNQIVPEEPEIPVEPEVPTEPKTLAIFDFGANGNASHKDGSSIGETKSYTSGSYTLTLTDASKVYDSAFDGTGNSCIKLGTSDAAATFTFEVPGNVTEVIIYVSGYKEKTVGITINGVDSKISTTSDSGTYTTIKIDTTTTKTIIFTTTTNKRAMINAIEFVG